MLWSDFSPYVLPFVIGAPEPLMALHVRLAAIEFCRRTLCHTRTLEPVTTDGISTLVEIEPEAGTQIVKIKAVTVGGREWTLVDPGTGLSYLRIQSTQSLAFTQDNISLQVSPLQVAGTEVVIEAAMAPTLTAGSFDDILGAQYAQDIAHGAIASLKRINGQPYSDLNGAKDSMGLFYGRINTVSAKIARGLVNTKMRSHIGFL
jgi:hypothetical protein